MGDKNSTATVEIGCKLPHGIWLELISEGNLTNPAPAGPKVRLRGANDTSVYVGTNPANGAFAITTVDKSFWDTWYARNKDLSFVKNGAVFVAENAKDAAAMAKDQKGAKTGFEPLSPDGNGNFKDSRMPKGIAADQEQMQENARSNHGRVAA